MINVAAYDNIQDPFLDFESSSVGMPAFTSVIAMIRTAQSDFP